jgi:hypothetical protein
LESGVQEWKDWEQQEQQSERDSDEVVGIQLQVITGSCSMPSTGTGYRVLYPFRHAGPSTAKQPKYEMNNDSPVLGPSVHPTFLCLLLLFRHMTKCHRNFCQIFFWHLNTPREGHCTVLSSIEVSGGAGALKIDGVVHYCCCTYILWY